MPARFAASVAVSRPTASRTPAYRDSSRRWNRTEPQTITGIGRNASSVSELAASSERPFARCCAARCRSGLRSGRPHSAWPSDSSLRRAANARFSVVTFGAFLLLSLYLALATIPWWWAAVAFWTFLLVGQAWYPRHLARRAALLARG